MFLELLHIQAFLGYYKRSLVVVVLHFLAKPYRQGSNAPIGNQVLTTTSMRATGVEPV